MAIGQEPQSGGNSNPRETNEGGPITFISRTIAPSQPTDSMWPIRLHDEKVMEAAREAIPKMIAELSHPLKPATKEQIKKMFEAKTGNRPWQFVSDEKTGNYVVSCEEFIDERGSIYPGFRYTYDNLGRLIQIVRFSNELTTMDYEKNKTYDNDGYLTRHTVKDFGEPLVIDQFDYSTTPDGKKVPVLMTRTIDQKDGIEAKPMTVDLAHYEDWLTKNPNGIARVEKEALDQQELRLDGYTVKENHSGIQFTSLADLELALIKFGMGTVGETSLDRGIKEVEQSFGTVGANLFADVMGSGNIRTFVQEQIMKAVKTELDIVRNSQDPNSVEKIYKHFDYSVGGFYKTTVKINVSKKGFELFLDDAYHGDEVEESLAKALGKNRGLRQETIEIPVNQTVREGYFLINITAICKKLGLPVTEEDVEKYITEWFRVYEEKKVKPDHGMPPDLVLYEDPTKGVVITLRFEIRDYDARVDLQEFFSTDGRTIWGPLPKDIKSREKEKDEKGNYPKVLIKVEAQGDPYDNATVQKVNDTTRSFTANLT